MMWKMLKGAALAVVALSVLGGCGENGGMQAPSPAPSPDMLLGSIQVVLQPGVPVFTPAITVSWTDTLGQQGQHSFSDGNEFSIGATRLVRLKVEVPPNLVMIGWNGPCQPSPQATPNDASVCEVTPGEFLWQRFSATLVQKQQGAWTLDMLHGSAAKPAQGMLMFCSAAAIDDEGTALVACHYGSGYLPFILQGTWNSELNVRTWKTLYAPPSENGPFIDTVYKIQAIGSASSQQFTDCRAIVQTGPDQLGHEKLKCVSPSGDIKSIGPNMDSVENFIVTDPSTNPVLLASQKATLFQNSSAGLVDGAWSSQKLNQRIPGLPPMQINGMSSVGKDLWLVGWYGAVIQLSSNGAASVEYPDLRKPQEDWAGIQALPDGTVWVFGNAGTILERKVSGAYFDRSATACGGISLSLIGTSHDDVWFAGGTGTCHWNGSIWESTLTDLGSSTPQFMAISPNGRHLLGLSQSGLVVTRDMP